MNNKEQLSSLRSSRLRYPYVIRLFVSENGVDYELTIF